MNVLISGAGIAGCCLAFWLERHGFRPTIVERAPRPRTGGYIIDFWGAGMDVVERMGLLSEIMAKGYKVREVRLVGSRGHRVGGFSVSVLDRVTRGRYTSLPRSELALSLHGALGDRVETIFDDAIAGIEDTGKQVQVRFLRAPERTFDLVIGADGLHSRVRQLVFGAEARFERFLGIKVAAFQALGYRPRDELVYVIHRDVGQQVGRFSMKDDRTMFLFVFADPTAELPADLAGQKALLRRRFSGSGWECPSILAALDGADDLYLDRVSQVRLDRWALGRVALAGDAAFCVSLLAGQGSALAMVAAYVLAGELKRAGGDHRAAFGRYQDRIAGLIATKQQGALKLASFFVPRSRFGIFLGDQLTKLMSLGPVAELAIGRALRDPIDLPEY
ncbi:MAG TPA: FAD-binding domain [Polyangia bacterium]|jgi:2-polyprenyl-6-methoxyphenol hydroxylase-like FAD-dependent oxidoreductase